MKDRALLLVASLPNSFDHFVTTLIFGKIMLKFNEDIKDLQSHVAMKRGGSESSILTGEGLVAKGCSERRGRSSSQGVQNRARISLSHEIEVVGVL